MYVYCSDPVILGYVKGHRKEMLRVRARHRGLQYKGLCNAATAETEYRSYTTLALG